MTLIADEPLTPTLESTLVTKHPGLIKPTRTNIHRHHTTSRHQTSTLISQGKGSLKYNCLSLPVCLSVCLCMPLCLCLSVCLSASIRGGRCTEVSCCCFTTLLITKMTIVALLLLYRNLTLALPECKQWWSPLPVRLPVYNVDRQADRQRN